MNAQAMQAGIVRAGGTIKQDLPLADSVQACYHPQQSRLACKGHTHLLLLYMQIGYFIFFPNTPVLNYNPSTIGNDETRMAIVVVV